LLYYFVDALSPVLQLIFAMMSDGAFQRRPAFRRDCAATLQMHAFITLMAL